METVLASIPHRPPFLFVDRVLEHGPEAIVCEWDVRADAPFFEGHYPGRPLVPGVLLCESVFQAGAILCASSADEDESKDVLPVLTRIGEARFKHMVVPGETLRIEVSLDERVASARFMTGRVTSDGRTVLRVQFAVALAPANAKETP